jgi:hypothetical protein
MTDETHTGENAGAGESTADDSNAASKCGDSISVSRRDVLRGGAALGLSPLFGTVSGVSDVDLDAVTWTAQNRTVKGRKFGANDRVATSNPDQWYAAHSTNTQLQYLGAQWERFGNPNATSDKEWHLKHTFALTSYSLALRPWGVKKEPGYSTEGIDWVPAVETRNLPKNVRDYLFEKHGTPLDTPGSELVPSVGGFKTEAEFEIKSLHDPLGDDEGVENGDETDHPTFEEGPPVVDDLAISVRRDSNLFGFADPENFWKSGFEGNEDALETDDGELEEVPPSLPMLRTLRNHVRNPMGAQYRDVEEHEAGDRVDRILDRRQSANEEAKYTNWFESSTGLALGLAGLYVGGALVTGGGLALAVWGWLNATESLLKSTPTQAPPYKGVHQSYPFNGSHPAAASFVMFDVYASPGEFDLKRNQLSVRVRHSESGIDDDNEFDGPTGGPSLDEESIWVIAFDGQVPDGPNDDYDPEKLHSARIVPPNQAETQLEHGSKDAHRITYDENDEIVTFRPEPTFSIEPEAPRAGDEVTFDPRNTMIGGAPIAKYEWDLRKFTQSRAGPDAEPTGQPRPISLPDDQKGAESNIFDSETEGVVQKRLNQPGRYEMKLTVWDEHDVSGEGYTVSKPFEVKPDAEMDLSVRIPDAPPTVAAGQPTTFEAEITDKPPVTDIAGNVPLTGEDVWLYEWDVLQNYEQFRPPGGVSPAFDDAEKVLDPTFEHAFERPGEYEVFVKVTDPLTGADGRYNVPVTVTEEPSYELAAGDEPHEYQLVTDSVTDSLTVRLEEPDSADFNLYATLDGRTPTVHDHDRRSYTSGDVEQITFHESEVGPIPDIKLIVSAYQGRGNYTLTVENEPDARLEYLGGDETPQDDEDDE